MFEWKKIYEVGETTIDEQHQHLFAMVNKISTDIEQGNKTREELTSSIDDLVAYSHKHFADEEAIMAHHNIDARHVKRQLMEHKSFVHDIAKFSVWSIDDKMKDRFERLVAFATAWLVFHTLRTDQALGLQIKAIEKGSTPEEAYLASEKANFNVTLYRQVLDAVIHLWTDASDRANHLEQILSKMGYHPE